MHWFRLGHHTIIAQVVLLGYIVVYVAFNVMLVCCIECIANCISIMNIS